MCIVFVLDGIFRPESDYNTTTITVYCICIGRNIPAGKLIQHNNNQCVLYLYWTEYSGRKVHTTQQQWMYIVFVLDGIFRPERDYNTTTMNMYCICIGRNIPAGKFIQHNNNEYVLYLYWTEYSGRNVHTTQQQWICIVFVLDGIFRPERDYNTTTINCVLYLYWTEYSGRKVDTTQQQWICIVFVLDGIFRPERDYNTTTITVYCICIGRNIPAGKFITTQQQWTVYCICIGRNIPAGKSIQHNNNQCVFYLYWTEYSDRKVDTDYNIQ